MNPKTLHSITLAAALSVGMLGTAAAAPYTTLNVENSHVTFGYSQMNVKMDGNFGQVKATEFNFDPASPEAAKVSIEIPLASIDAGYAEANAELEKNEWLDLANHPIAGFRSTKVESLGDNRYEVTGQLTVKGNTKEVSVPFTVTEKDESATFEGQFTFPRAHFGIGEGPWGDFSIVANDIQIRFSLVATQ